MKAKILRECLGPISKLVLIHFSDYGTGVARTNKVNTNAFDTKYHVYYVDCGNAVAGFDEIFQSPGILKFSPFGAKNATHESNSFFNPCSHVAT